jgi:hypothetical protein
MSAEVLRRDVHPAEIVIGDTQLWRDVRCFVTSQRLLAYRAGPHGQIEQCLNVALALPCSVPANRGTLVAGRLEVLLADGATAWVNRGAGCGCGSPLKALASPVPWVAPRSQEG